MRRDTPGSAAPGAASPGIVAARAATSPRPAGPRRRGRRRLAPLLFIAPAVLFVGATVVYPLLYSVLQSFFDIGLREVVQGGARWVGLDNYVDQFDRPRFWDAFAVSAVYTVASVALTFAIGLGLALLLRRPFRGRDVLRALILVAWVLPTVVSANVWRWLLDGSYGLLNALLRALGLLEGDLFWLGRPTAAVAAVVIATAWSFAPFAMILLAAGLEGIPKGLYEAARIDGASPWRQFRHLTLPQLRPVSLAALLLVFIYTFKNFDTIFLMTAGGPGGATATLPVYAYNEAFEFSRFDTASVATTVLMIVPIALSLWYFRALRKEQSA
ncbi:multiple sugar transport system permease protein/arabinogalactan oligomer / maltooligosaccharide transport system permease protein/N,N'-diacetylchitobiose transport system permease protein [Glycomyces sambucus]|uniref:Multiple sugar transport system permease protein/arabinogalactan oligomer / maltooligosaccharide transport system permease protein/N,N'-diacetylchitobiose transport system permease protein n=1 Tax=Glycomyces sambucus TaxID=380244 RepID=A0A1G9DEK1_9ACTN|nr:sugar ABC transporter permease [Glycomyces sambucus]SDK62293.1 multiple sugar transport system permease protein/arabinogalactan oligomer / maltooligosaccharide transport system permease protein/N,N'-diacetylchitobiose transport system permease protein [Glycomyces sambucus]